jgi:hypothetical protein
MAVPAGVAAVVREMQDRLDAMPGDSPLRDFLSTYQRTTTAVGQAITDGVFADGEWVEEWDVVFAQLYVRAYDAHIDGGHVPRPWRIAFDAPADLPSLRKVLLGINAHINYDLPQALLGVISDADFADPVLLGKRKRDHEAIDGVLASRVAAEDDELTATGGKSLVDRVLQPLNRVSSKRFLREARQKVWHNTHELQVARLAGPAPYDVRLGELELLSAAKVADLLAPGQVLLRLAVAGFGVVLPPAA